MRLFITVSSWLLVLVGVVLLVLPVRWFPSFYDSRYTGFASLLGAFVIQLIQRLLGVWSDAKKNSKGLADAS